MARRKKADPKSAPTELSRRERQIMGVVHEKGSATVLDVVEALNDPDGFDSIRVTLRILEQKGHLTHQAEGPRYIYSPTTKKEAAAGTAFRQMVKTFFGGSVSEAVSFLVSSEDANLSQDDLDRIAKVIDDARKESNP